MRILAFGTYDPDYARNKNVLDGLRLNGVEVVECCAPLWTGTDDKVASIRGGWQLLGFAGRMLRAYAHLVRQYTTVGDYDVILILYGTLLDFYLGRVLSWIRRRPLVLDVLMSVWVICKERGLFQPGGWRERVIRLIEGTALHTADYLFADTPQYVAIHERVYGVAPTKFGLIPLGTDSRLFSPAPDYLVHAVTRRPTFQVVYHGLFVPLHGTQWIVEAAARLRKYADIHFAFIGEGVARATAEAEAHRLGLTNVTFTVRVPRAALHDRLRDADVVMGVFGSQLQGQVSTPNKIYEGMAMGKPVITAYTPAAAHKFQHAQHVYFIPIADPSALAEAILTLRNNPSLRAALAYGGLHLFRARYDVPHLGALARGYLERILSS